MNLSKIFPSIKSFRQKTLDHFIDPELIFPQLEERKTTLPSFVGRETVIMLNMPISASTLFLKSNTMELRLP